MPLRDPSFGDIGQVYDPWVYLGWIAAQTRTIALATGSIILPLRHPLHTAKASASIDQLSGGRFVLGVASGAVAGSERWPRGGFVKPCSLDGVNRFISPKVLATPRSPDDTGLSDGGMGFGGL